MALDATGTPTSPDSIPTLNTSVDAPSGNGFNAAMAQVQAIVTALKAGTLASGKIQPAGVNWTGAYPFTNADIAAAAALAPSKFAGYPADATKVLKGDGSWGTAGALVSLVADSKLAVDTASWDIQNIPGNPGDKLKFSIVGRTADTNPWLGLRLNNDSGNNYIDINFGGTQAATITGGLDNNQPSMPSFGFLATSGAPASYVGQVEAWITDYAGTDWYKAIHALHHAVLYDNSASRIIGTGALWRNAAAVTRATIINTDAGNIKALSRLNMWREAIA